MSDATSTNAGHAGHAGTSSSRNDALSPGLAVFAAAGDIAVLGDHLQRLRRDVATLGVGGPEDAAAWCAAHDLPATLVVDISASDYPLAALMALAAQSGPATRIVALGQRQDVDFYRQLLQAGIFDYMVTPVQLDLLADVLARADARTPLGQGGGARTGRTAAFVGVAGGLGTSTLVAALGQWLAGTRRHPTVLVDFDRRKGDLPLLLGLEADAGLSGILTASEVDPRLLQRTLLAAASPEPSDARIARLHLLAQRPGPETPIHPERALELGGALCQLFSLSLWDLPSHRPDGADDVLAQADIRVVLTELSVQGARNTHRLLAEIGDESEGQRLLLVASPTRTAAAPALDTAQFQDFIGRGVDLALPHAGNALAASLLQGPLAVPPAAPYARAVAALGHRLLGLPESQAQAEGLGARWRRWLGRPARMPSPAQA